jgi:DivIVA domain-containing protein
MALSPQTIRDHQFKPSRRGYDSAEVDQFRTEVADALEAAQNEATAMEARARAAVARLQELSKAQAAGDPSDPTAASIHPSVDESETISRTLLLAQRTADTTVAEAQGEADRLLDQAREEAAGRLESAHVEAERLVEQSREDARKAGESERVRVEGEVQALLARRDFLESDVDHLEQFITAQRERITEAVSELNAIVQRVPNGLGDMRRPLLSAAADEPRPGADAADAELTEITRVAQGADTMDAEYATVSDDAVADDVPAAGVDETGDVWARRDEPPEATASHAEAMAEPDDRA